MSQNQPNTEPSETTPKTLESNFNLEVSAEAQNKIVRLFTYLEKALSLDDTVVRNFRTAMTPPSPWWLALKNEGDSYELLLGHGVLTWKHTSVGAIYSPVFLTPLVLDFDAAKRTIEISPDPMFRNFVEITPVSEMDNPAEIDLDTWMGTINANPFDFWHFESLKSQANTFLNLIARFLSQGKTVLVTSQTSKALEVLRDDKSR